MNTRWMALTGALALALAAPQATASAVTSSAASQSGALAADRGSGTENGLARLRADANGKVRVHRTTDGAVDFLSSTNGRAMLDARGTDSPRRTVTDQLARYGQTFGIDGSKSRAVVTQTDSSTTGGSVVRSEQVVDGVPVFGGQIVMSLDKDQGVVSVDAATTPATEVPAARVSEASARQTALRVTARTHHVAAGSLKVTGQGRQLYDPAILHTADPLGVRPVWAFEVTNAVDVRETVLIGTGRGEVAVHFDNTPELNRRVCDNGNKHTVSGSDQVPICSSPARVEGGATKGGDIDAAYDNLGATSDAYAQLDDLDLTALIGANVGGTKSLASTVRWCFSDDTCPYANAFWDGRQMVFGKGYAGADDVVGHELTHGYVARTSNLFYFHQSGALNESLADTIGEIVDHRNPLSTQSDSAWTVGEDLGVPDATRSMKDPTLHDQPDRMTSPNWDSSDVFEDNGAVHANDGVGNKTAYLISQGGTFNGQTITGIDGSDAGLAKTGRLYLETIPRLTSGSEYADLGRVLASTCDQLVASSSGGFTTDNCDQVRKAIVATQLSSAPTSGKAAAEAPISCPSGGPVDTLLQRDDDDIDGFGFSTTSSLWGRTPAFAPSYSTSGTESLFAYDPDPQLRDPASGSMTSAPFTVPATTGGTYLNFHHAYVLDWDGNVYYHGGEVVVSKLVNGVWTKVSGLPWVNGPNRHIRGNTKTGFTGFGGDSYGYGSSQVDLSSLAGQRVEVAFRIEGGTDIAYYGWWIDDVRLYGCDTAEVPATEPLAPTAPTAAAVSASATSATVSWKAPVDQGTTPIDSYRITRSDAGTTTVTGTHHSAPLTGFDATTTQTVTIEAVNGDTLVGPPATVHVYPTTAKVSSSTTRVASNKKFTVTGKVVRRGSSSVIRSMPVVLQRKASGAHSWSNVSSGTTGSKGTKTWTVKLTKTTAYRVVARGATYNFGSISASRTVKKH